MYKYASLLKLSEEIQLLIGTSDNIFSEQRNWGSYKYHFMGRRSSIGGDRNGCSKRRAICCRIALRRLQPEQCRR